MSAKYLAALAAFFPIGVAGPEYLVAAAFRAGHPVNSLPLSGRAGTPDNQPDNDADSDQPQNDPYNRCHDIIISNRCCMRNPPAKQKKANYFTLEASCGK